MTLPHPQNPADNAPVHQSNSAKEMPSKGSTNVPSLAYLLAVMANTATIVWLCSASMAWRWPALGMLIALQSVLMIGVQEAKHQCVHRQFVRGHWMNEAVGVLTAALFAVNFVGYRGFHLEHHRRTCQADDPEGLLYGLSWKTRLVALLGPAETLYVAAHINWFSRLHVPSGWRLRWHLNNLAVLAVLGALSTGLWLSPLTMLCAWLLPFCVFAWLDFLLTQAEHYDAAIVQGGTRRSPADITLDLRLPGWLSWLVLHRTLHRIHHHAPATRWFEALGHSAALRRLRPGQETTLAAFFGQWMRGGPRLWTID